MNFIQKYVNSEWQSVVTLSICVKVGFWYNSWLYNCKHLYLTLRVNKRHYVCIKQQ